MGCPRGCSQLQGKRRINHSIPYTIPLLPPGKATKHPGSTCRALAAPPGYQGNLGRCPAQPQHSPYPLAPRAAREDARGSERASPPPSSSCCCFGNWGRKKKRGFVWESKAQAGLVGLGHVRVACRQHPGAAWVAARGHGRCHRIDHGFVPPGRSCPRRNAAGEGLAALVWKPNRLIEAPLLVLACREGRCMRVVGQE